MWNFRIFTLFIAVTTISESFLFCEASKNEGECEVGLDGKCLGESIADQCVDDNEQCEFWAKRGECDENPAYMKVYCIKSCGLCASVQHGGIGIGNCADLHEMCSIWASFGECFLNPRFMTAACRLSCFLCVDEDESRMRGESEELIAKRIRLSEMDLGPYQALVDEATQEHLKEMDKYIKDTISSPHYDSVRKFCTNRDDLCAHWASSGKCLNETAFMMQRCSLACFFCDQNELFMQCHIERGTHFHSKKIVNTNDMFTAIHSDIWNKYEPEFISKPLHEKTVDPWLVLFQSLVTKEESKLLLELANGLDWQEEKSASYAGRRAVCDDKANCEKDNTFESVMNRIADVTAMPRVNFEYMEFFEYSDFGAFNGRKNDYKVHDVWKPAGERIYSLLICLSDVEKGGGTGFPQIDWTVVHLKRGQALLWSNVKEENDLSIGIQDKMIYETLPVIKGKLVVARVWIHLNDWRSEVERGCV